MGGDCDQKFTLTGYVITMEESNDSIVHVFITVRKD